MIYLAQSILPLYLEASNPYILVLTTSTGVLAYTEAAPANPPANSKAIGSGINEKLDYFVENNYYCNLFFSIFINQKSNSLIGTLFQYSRSKSFVNSSESLFFNNSTYSME